MTAQHRRVYHDAPAAATACRKGAAALILVMGLHSAVAGAVVPVVANALPSVPTAAAPVLPAAQVEARLRQGILDLFATPQKLLSVVPLELPPDEMRKTLFAMDVLFRPARIEELTLQGVTSAGHVASMRLVLRNIDVFGLRVDQCILVAEDFAVDLALLTVKGQVLLTGDAHAKMSARVTEADLNRVSPAYRMEIGHDDFAVSGRAGVLFIRAGYNLHGSVHTTPDNTLVFRPKSLSYGILPIPHALYASQVRRINPIFDMARFLGLTRGAFDLHFDAVSLEKQVASVSLSGTLHAKPLKVEPLPPPPPRQ